MTDKISRKDLKQPDEFVTFTKTAVEWLVAKRMTLLMGTAVVAAAVLAAYGLHWYGESKAREASRLFMEARRVAMVAPQNTEGESSSEATSKSAEERYRTAITDLEKVKKTFSGTDTAALATFFIGQYSHLVGDNDKAIESFKEYLAREGFEGELASSAVEGIAVSYESKDLIPQAIENYKRLCETPLETECDRGLYHLACLEQKAGKLQEAAVAFRTILEKYPKTHYAQEITERLLMLPKPAEKPAETSDKKPETPIQSTQETQNKEQ